MIATIFELWQDRNGDLDKALDLWFRVAFFILEAFLLKWIFGGSIFLAFNLSVAIFFLCFDYLIAIILWRNGVINDSRWYKVLSKKGVIDNLPIWKNLGSVGRLLVRVGYFILAVILYVKL